VKKTKGKIEIVARGILASGMPGTSHATYTFPSIVFLSNGVVLATSRVGSTKDSDDEKIEIYRSDDSGQTWSKGKNLFAPVKVNGKLGSLKLCYLTEINKGHLIVACMWVDRQSYPNKPLFNEETEGCLPMEILLSDSFDNGKTWTSLRKISLPDDLGPKSLTGPILKLKDGSIALTIEANKHYLDGSKWKQRVVIIHSLDDGKTWEEPITIREDVSGKIFYWDLRAGVDALGNIVAFSWTYNRENNTYLNIHQLISSDHGKTWSDPEDIGITDQPSHPALMMNGSIVLAWVDRFKSQSIRVRMASNIDQDFDENTELILHTQKKARSTTDNTGDLLSEMSLWSFGLPFAEVLPDNDVMIMYYAGNKDVMDIHWVRLRINQ
jgi:Neuraminidase (sialidase)